MKFVCERIINMEDVSIRLNFGMYSDHDTKQNI